MRKRLLIIVLSTATLTGVVSASAAPAMASGGCSTAGPHCHSPHKR